MHQVKTKKMSDEDLVKGCIEGKASAQKALYDTYSGKMMSICLRYMGNVEDAQDVLQEAFIKIFGNMGSFKGEGPLGGWIRRIVINTSLIHLRKDKKWSFKEDITEMNGLAVNSESALEKMSADELMKIINQMPDGYRTVFNLYAIEGFKHKEIAAQMGITESTSKTQYRKARNYIKKLLEETEEAFERR